MTRFKLPYFDPETPKQVGDNFRKIDEQITSVINNNVTGGGNIAPVKRLNGVGPFTSADIATTDAVIIFGPPGTGSTLRAFTLPAASAIPYRVLTLKLDGNTNVDAIDIKRFGSD